MWKNPFFAVNSLKIGAIFWLKMMWVGTLNKRIVQHIPNMTIDKWQRSTINITYNKYLRGQSQGLNSKNKWVIWTWVAVFCLFFFYDMVNLLLVHLSITFARNFFLKGVLLEEVVNSPVPASTKPMFEEMIIIYLPNIKFTGLLHKPTQHVS